MNANHLIQHLQLQPHPEGGFYRETHKGESSAIFFLLREGDCSLLHRIQEEEIWHFYLGGPLELSEIAPDGKVTQTRLGANILAGETPQRVVPPGHWQGAKCVPGSEFTLVGCTVAPAFQFAHFEMGGREKLLELFPKSAALIHSLTASSRQEK